MEETLCGINPGIALSGPPQCRTGRGPSLFLHGERGLHTARLISPASPKGLAKVLDFESGPHMDRQPKHVHISERAAKAKQITRAIAAVRSDRWGIKNLTTNSDLLQRYINQMASGIDP